MIWFALLLCVAAIAATPVVLENRRVRIGKTQRKAAPGKFARLSQGVTYYRWTGSVRGPVLVMVHGLSTPSVVFDIVAAGMGALGYRVLVYDLYGRGLSDAPTAPQDRAFFLQQLTDLLDDQGLGEDLTFVGYSMGGAIATAFAASHPHRMKRLILIASAGIIQNESKFAEYCRENRIIGDWVHGALAAFRLRQSLSKNLPKTSMETAQLAELNRQGFLPAVLSSRRGMLTEKQEAEHRAISRIGIPVVAIWGDADTIIPLSALGQLAQWNRLARQEVVKDAGHGLPHTHGNEILVILRDVFRET